MLRFGITATATSTRVCLNVSKRSLANFTMSIKVKEPFKRRSKNFPASYFLPTNVKTPIMIKEIVTTKITNQKMLIITKKSGGL